MTTIAFGQPRFSSVKPATNASPQAQFGSQRRLQNTPLRELYEKRVKSLISKPVVYIPLGIAGILFMLKFCQVPKEMLNEDGSPKQELFEKQHQQKK